jgi:hypothetical protein
MKITKNIGGTDMAIRTAAGVLLLALADFTSLGAWGLIGIIPLSTAVLGVCPLYTLLGIDTRKPRDA